MFKWLKGMVAPAKEAGPVPLCFKDANAAFQYACEYLDSELKVAAVLPALVLDAGALLGNGPPVRIQPDGGQVALLRICAKDGGFVLAAATANTGGPKLQPGDLVAWGVVQYTMRLLRSGDDSRSQWNGLIVAKLRPEYTVGRGWAIEYPFRGA
jgi:hypothetical protein